MELSGDKKLNEVREDLIEKYSLNNPGLASENKGNLYIPGPLGKKTQARLEMTLNELISNGLMTDDDVIEVTDKAIPTALRLYVHIK